MITLIEIRKRLSETIRQSEMTQEQLAQQLHINQSQISCYIHGKKLPALDTLANLCKILDVDANYILCQDLKNN
ncbi:MAG TPA: helix-turn-helix domain-containing protein [Firmicutes bacterium]|nr:helix-turn-helix domain-containing protein [Bacillota bacterium]